ncbi:MAG TPA: class I SAM-dependent methyltransferase [Candidatus Lokiarchaeia archaeon]|nr:class I SAM-dependent methyltransferase [Candidatus Lokiarchaeia archaeon]
MEISYVGGAEKQGAEFWVQRVGWDPSDVARAIAATFDPACTPFVADIGGAHGREALWLAEQGFRTLLVDPNGYSLRLARERVKKRALSVSLIRAALPYIPLRSGVANIVDFYWALHQIPDATKQASLQEIARFLASDGKLFSTSFGYWVDREMPASITPFTTLEAFVDLHLSAGLLPQVTAEEKTDPDRIYEHFWQGVFQKHIVD